LPGLPELRQGLVLCSSSHDAVDEIEGHDAVIPIAIVGNGAAAAETIIALRQNGYSGEVHLFADNDHGPYNPMLGPYVVKQKIPEDRAFPFGYGRSFYDAHGVTAHLGAAVTALDPLEQTLTTADGAEHRYQRCVLATGARPSLPPIKGLREAVADPGAPVYTIQTFADAILLKGAVERIKAQTAAETAAPRAAVIGASFAGVKVADVLHELGFRVTLIEREASILPLSAHPWCARLLEEHLLSEGYDLRLGAALAGIDTASGNVRLDFGALPGVADPEGAGGTACEESVPQDEVHLAVACTGSRPALGFLAPGTVDMGVGILVDEQMRSSIPSLYAAGDVAQGRNLLSGRHEIIGLWASARYQGRAAGRSLAGVTSGYRGSVPHNITHVGKRLFASVGCLREYDEITTCTDGDSYQLRVWQDGRLAGVNLIDHCLAVGALKQGLLRAATGAVSDMEATWISFNG
jgi:NADPH-dependent 2,4-dienoyl-CoA reductase/sulfur reductase-like enzyme